MNTNSLSAFVLASVACMSMACVNTSQIDDGQIAAMVDDASSEAQGGTATISGVQAKSASADGLVIPPSDMPFGVAYEDWAAAYWQWAMSIPLEKNPILDADCDVNQSGSVFFLAGNTGGAHTRACKIPRGKGILIPLMSAVARACPEMVTSVDSCAESTSDPYLYKVAENAMNSANPEFLLTIDGRPVSDLSQFRVSSDVFADTSPANEKDRLFETCSGPIQENICGVSPERERNAVTDGYFVMLRQLSDGPHQIHIAGRMGPNSTEPDFEVTYDIFVSSPQSAPTY